MTDQAPEPGDLVVVNTMNQAAAAIELVEWLSDHRPGLKVPAVWSQWNHVAVCTRVNVRRPGMYVDGPSVQIMIAEAEPGGAVERLWHYEDVPHVWSTGIIETNQAVADAAVRYTRPGPWGKHGVPYSFLDYAAVAAHLYGLNLSAAAMREYLKTVMHMMCSQFGDRCKLDGGVHLFDDGRWEGFVRPSDIGALLPAWQPS